MGTNSGFSNLVREVEGVPTIQSTKIQVNSFVTHSGIQFIQYTAVYQQQQTGYGAHHAPCIIGIPCLSCGLTGWLLALAIQKHLALRLKKIYTNTSTATLGIHNLFLRVAYFSSERKLRGKFACNTPCITSLCWIPLC
jgi:hypothetical protein